MADHQHTRFMTVNYRWNISWRGSYSFQHWIDKMSPRLPQHNRLAFTIANTKQGLQTHYQQLISLKKKLKKIRLIWRWEHIIAPIHNYEDQEAPIYHLQLNSLLQSNTNNYEQGNYVYKKHLWSKLWHVQPNWLVVTLLVSFHLCKIPRAFNKPDVANLRKASYRDSGLNVRTTS